MIRRTKIVCTIGPSSDSEEMLVKMMNAGMNVARVNFSHGTHEYHREVIRRIKRLRRTLERPVAILQDLQGPKIRIGVISGGAVQLRPGQEFLLTSKNVSGDATRASASARVQRRGFFGAAVVNGFCAMNAALLAPTIESFGVWSGGIFAPMAV